ncbi:MAG: tetratricopeptide repeat protein [Bacteroidota bacterium]|nr:tetratricopeptide repeat protein [Candidatus Kapabacteria bacterium]MCX7936461.1 tetratricopeptide repeat protein [Chlorobiota bacterium]MDW8074259.1 tetratricopeptide repeat protein [Bacteroidota bacterium]
MNNARVVSLVLAVVTVLNGCRLWDNTTTYFNTYYNMRRLETEITDEFRYHDEFAKPPKPRVVVPMEPDLVLERPALGALPAYLDQMVIKSNKLQPVRVKVDSIIIKGSKILALHGQSDFVDGTLYLMALAYFFRSEWLPSAIKCQELILQFPQSPYSPDAHLLAAKNYLLQRNISKAEQMLSRTVDIAWEQLRYDVLSEAFRLQAELAIEQGNFDRAVRPYRQAIAQCPDEAQRAIWQVDMGLLLYRLRRFALAERELAIVEKYSPDNLRLFECRYYRALALSHLGRFAEAEAILDDLESQRRFDDYIKAGYITGARMELLRLAKRTAELDSLERAASQQASASDAILVAHFERGLEYFRVKDYDNAIKYFATAKVRRSPVFDGAKRLFDLLNIRQQKLQQLTTLGGRSDDSSKRARAYLAFELGRTHQELGNSDSAATWYLKAIEDAPLEDTTRAQYLYALARLEEVRQPKVADSLLMIVFHRYPFTEYGREAKQRLGFTDYAVTDTAADLLSSGEHLRRAQNYSLALRQLQKVVDKFPTSPHAPRALYLIGWTWENNLRNNDSALYYYTLLVRRYPTSIYANDVSRSVAFAIVKREGAPPPWWKEAQPPTPSPGLPQPTVPSSQSGVTIPSFQKPGAPGSMPSLELPSGGVVPNPDPMVMPEPAVPDSSVVPRPKP